MSLCCETPKFDGLSAGFKRALWIIIAINGTMFVVEMIAGFAAGSKALQADALDFLGDAATYCLTLAVVGMPLRTRALAAMVKGLSMIGLGLWIFGSTLYQVLILDVPSADVMGAVGFLALAANLFSVVILLKFREGDANVRSVWLCSRNDAIGNVAVMVAALAVWLTNSAWPDLVAAALMAVLFICSAIRIIAQAADERRGANTLTVMQAPTINPSPWN